MKLTKILYLPLIYQWLNFTLLLVLLSKTTTAQQNRFSLRTDPYSKFSSEVRFISKDYILFNAEVRPIDRKLAPNYMVTYRWSYERIPHLLGNYYGLKRWLFSIGLYEPFFQYTSSNQKFRVNSSIGLNPHIIRNTLLFEDRTLVLPIQAGLSLSVLSCISMNVHSRIGVFISAEIVIRKELYQFGGDRINNSFYSNYNYPSIGLIYWFKKQGEKKAE